MGLGKTYQALAFLAWAKANLVFRGRHYPTAPALGPMLVVAPTALLQNWQNEEKMHLTHGGLGEAAEAFGSGLKALKRPRGDSWTPEDALELERLRGVDWILTTYETLANHHRAFARIPYSVVVFDEIQKLKEPGSINTRSAKTINAEFVIGLTGTPIENRIEDIWSIFDRIAPGYLGALREFSARYGTEDPEPLIALKASLDTPRDGLPAPMLRRMKDKARDSLLDKKVKTYRAEMPKVQAEAYLKIVAEARGDAGSRMHMLEAIHRLRGVCLHPHRADSVDTGERGSVEAWLQGSARLRKTVEILQQIEAHAEKAIVFVEDLAVQRTFAEAMATLLDLPTLPGIINGSVPGHRRQKIVDEFQKAPYGFDLLVLSPKAAGVGLNITAANHVLHLSRWWNPAVEDQCNDRAYRIGQTRDVTIHVPLAIHPLFGEQSFDVKLDALLERKRNLSRHMLCPPESKNDLDSLFGEVIR
jgi:SNF2 family DNA or RNA helicase